MQKEKWIIPQLIVLIRGKHGEVVLGVCKIADPFPTGANAKNFGCHVEIVHVCTTGCFDEVAS